MLVFDENWQVSRGKTKIVTDPRHQIEIRVSCTQDVQLLGVRGKEEVPLKIGREFRIRAETRGFESLILKGHNQVQYGFRIAEISRQVSEPLDDANPPAAPMPNSDNLVLQMRRLVNEQMSRHRAPRLDPEDDLPFPDRYVVEDDDFDFEEEIFASEQKALAEKLEKEKAAAENPPPEPPAVPEAPPESGEPPAAAQEAAE